jgi:hypothetical protein
MSIAQIKDELTHLPANQQDQLAAFLTRLRLLRDEQLQKELQDSSQEPAWISLDQLKEHWAE